MKEYKLNVKDALKLLEASMPREKRKTIENSK